MEELPDVGGSREGKGNVLGEEYFQTKILKWWVQLYWEHGVCPPWR